MHADDGREDSFDTLAVHAGAEPDELTGAVSPPIYQTSTFAQDGVAKPRRGYEYARSQNPTRERLERALAVLEGGSIGIAFASGSATTAAIAELAGPGDEIVVGDDVYGGTFRYLERVHRGKGVDARYVDLSAGPDALPATDDSVAGGQGAPSARGRGLAATERVPAGVGSATRSTHHQTTRRPLVMLYVLGKGCAQTPRTPTR